MGRIVSLLDREYEPAVIDLLAESQVQRGVDAGGERASATAREYATNELYALWGYEEDGAVVGLAGIEWSEEGRMRLMDLAVAPEQRRRGVGRALTDHLCHTLQPLAIAGVTAAAAVPFFEAAGFTVGAFGAMPDGLPRYRFLWRLR